MATCARPSPASRSGRRSSRPGGPRPPRKRSPRASCRTAPGKSRPRSPLRPRPSPRRPRVGEAPGPCGCALSRRCCCKHGAWGSRPWTPGGCAHGTAVMAVPAPPPGHGCQVQAPLGGAAAAMEPLHALNGTPGAGGNATSATPKRLRSRHRPAAADAPRGGQPRPAPSRAGLPTPPASPSPRRAGGAGAGAARRAPWPSGPR